MRPLSAGAHPSGTGVKKMSEPAQQRKLPRIGMRIVKSALGVFLCFVIYILRGRRGAPFYSALAVLWCIQNYTRNTLSNAMQRTVGTVIGACYGLIFILCKLYVADFGNTLWHYLMLAAMIVPVIYTAVLFHRKNAAYFSCVVYLSIVVNHLADANPFLFVLDRTMDTMIGILLGLAINSAHLPGKPCRDTLFAVDLDNALRSTHEQLTPYSRITMNSLLESGMELTVMTLRTPATFLEALSDLQLRLPIIAMDGAVLYDTGENCYVKKHVMLPDLASRVEQFILRRGFHLFSNVILEDVLLIYCGSFRNDAERQIYDTLHRSPYRNYLHRPRPADQPVVYFMVIDGTERIRGLYREMAAEGLEEQCKLLCYPSDDYPGYSYLKIYSKEASVGKMLEALRRERGLEKIVTVGDDHSRRNVDYACRDSNLIVHSLNKLFYRSGGQRS